MSEQPKRIQRKRTKGWTMPEGAVYVGRPTKFGNPFVLDLFWESGYSGGLDEARKWCVERFRQYSLQWRERAPEHLKNQFEELRGKDLACWCPLDQPCHADVLLELANAD